MDKTTKTNPADDKATPKATPRAIRRRPDPRPPIFNSPQEERAWYEEQTRITQELAEAQSKYPPGTKLYVTTKGISSRSRSGVRFTNQGRTEVEVVDLYDDELAKVRAGDDSILPAKDDGSPHPMAARIRSGSTNAVSSLGAKAIANDDALIVYRGPDEKTAVDSSEYQAEIDARDGRIKELEATLAKRDAEIARLKSGKGDSTGAPERLAKGAAPAGDFGADDGKAKG